MPNQEIKQVLQKELAHLQGLRDELKVQLNLGKAEAKEEWDKLERKWGQVETELSKLGEHAKEPIEQIGQAARSLIGELKGSYDKLRQQIKS